MATKKSTALYRPFFREAWNLTRTRRGLWIFGIFAALLSTGGVVDVGMASIKKVKGGGNLLEQLMDSTFIGYELAAQYMTQLQILGPDRSGTIIVVSAAVAGLLIFIATISQSALILGLKKNHVPNSKELKKEAHAHFWPLLGLGLLNKVLTSLLIMLMMLPLFYFYISTSAYSATLFFVLMMIFIPAIIIINIIYMFALMELVLRKKSFFDSIHLGAQLFAKQWIAAFEYGLLLFFIVFFAGLLLIGGVILFAVPYAIIFTATLLTGSLSLFITVNTLFAIALVALFMTFGGASVTFQYAAWYLFFKRGVHKAHGKKVFSKIIRLVHA
jgi:hypothetical protein